MNKTFNMNREQKVATFNQIMGQPVAQNPEEVPLKMRQLGIGLIFEELKELAEASGCEDTFYKLCEKARQSKESWKPDSDNVDKVLQLDALADVQYTASWAVNVFGHSKHFESAFTEVCRSNDTKGCVSMEEAEETKKFWEAEENTPHHIDPVQCENQIYFVVKRSSDGKVRKSVNYSPANFKQFIQ